MTGHPLPRRGETAINDPFAQRPESGEYAPFYAPYLAAMPDGSVLHSLREQIDDTLVLLGGLDERQAEHCYAPGKWSVKEAEPVEHCGVR